MQLRVLSLPGVGRCYINHQIREKGQVTKRKVSKLELNVMSAFYTLPHMMIILLLRQSHQRVRGWVCLDAYMRFALGQVLNPVLCVTES